MPSKSPTPNRLKDFASRLSLLKNEAGRLGLFETMQKLDVPLQAVGFEIERKIAANVT
jgi:hypothetical protein